MLNEIKQDAEQRMDKSVHALHEELRKLRAGRAHPALLDHVRVDYYGAPVPLNQVANVHAEDARTLLVMPYEKQMVAVVDKAIREADLGLNPATAGQSIRVPLPLLTEERRHELTRVVRAEGENTRVALRNIRRDANHQFKEALKEKLISQDEQSRGEALIQKLTDDFVSRVDRMVEEKEADLLEL